MLKGILIPLIAVSTLSAFSQENDIIEKFKTDFAKALDIHFTEKQLDKMFSNYTTILTSHSDVTQLTERLKGHPMAVFPLYYFKNEKLYTDNISHLLDSKNPNQRILAYLVIASSYDTSKESILLHRIETEKNTGNLTWAGMALLALKCNHTTALFDFLIKNENFSDTHMFPMYVKLDKDSLQQTAYNRINSKDVTTKIVAAQVLSVTPLNEKTATLLKEAVRTWDTDIKGYAIYSLKELRTGNLLETLKPLLNDKKTRSISLDALANSPTEEDRNYLFALVDKEDTVSTELLDCFYQSKDTGNVTYWLKLLYTRPVPAQYTFFTFKQPAIHSDAVLPDLQIALQKITNKHILSELVRALEGRTDDKSVDILVTLLKHTSSLVRYWTAMTVAESPAEKFKDPEINKLIQQGLKDGNNPDD